MKRAACSRNKFFSVGLIVFFMLLISACTPGGWGEFHPPGTAPTIISANNTTVTEGTAATFTVTATGDPVPIFAIAEPLPAGLTFNPITGVLSGTPTAGTAGTYPLTITAINGVPPDATQIFTLTVVIPPITSLSEVGQIATGDAAVVICRGNYAYTAGWNAYSNNFNIVDMSDPTTPAIKGSYSVGDGYGLALNGNYAYVQTDGGGTGIFSPGTVGVINITDPTTPAPVMADATGYSSAYQSYYYKGYVYNASANIIGIYSVAGHPATLVPVTNISTSSIEWLAFSGNYMYGSDGGALKIWDISNPALPVLTGSISDADLNYYGIAVNGNYVFAMGTNGGKGEVLVYNVSDKTNPIPITKLVLTGGTSDSLFESRILGNYLLIAGSDDFYVVNIADPTVPVEITSIVTSTSGEGWGFDVLNDRYAIVADDVVYHVIKLW